MRLKPTLWNGTPPSAIVCLGCGRKRKRVSFFPLGPSDRRYIFPELFSSMVEVGEESGTLEDVLDILTKQMEKEHELKSKIKGAMIYPSVIIAAMVCIGILMLVLVVPNLAKTFDELEIELPLSTRLVIA